MESVTFRAVKKADQHETEMQKTPIKTLIAYTSDHAISRVFGST
jgi:hypothetical protein